MTSIRERRGRTGMRALTITAVLVALTGMLLLVTPARAPLPLAVNWVPFAPLSFAFAISERAIFNVEYRKHAMSLSLSEVPVAAAVLLVDPWTAVMSRVVGGGLVLASRVRRTGLVKPAFNLALFGFEVALAAGVLGWVVVPRDVSPVVISVAAGGAAFIASAIGSFFVVLVIAQNEGGFTRRLRANYRQGLGVWFLGSLIAVVVLVHLSVDPWLVLVPLIPILMVWRLLSSLGDLGQRHHDLAELHDFTREVGNSLDLDSVVTSACEQTQRLLRAQGAGVVVFGPDGQRLRVRSDIGESWWPRSVDDERWRDVIHGEETVSHLSLKGPGADPSLAATRWSDVLVAPLADGEGRLGLLVVADRIGAQSRFSSDDVLRLRSLADQLVVSLRKSLLHIRLEHNANHDALTGLPNRMLFETKVEAALGREGPVTVLLLDLDRFKEVNDGLGHHVGDVLLQKFAERMLSVLPPDTVVARLAGDEFAILATGLPRATAVELGARILRAARDPFDLGELSVAVSCSIGLVLGPEQGGDASTLLRRADLAMYEAKGRSGGVSLYRPDLETTNSQRLRLLQDLRVATVDEQMKAWFQPKIHLGDRVVVGVEALVRWDHPEQGVLDAERFIGLAEQTDLIHTITDRMLTSALSAARSWRRRGWALGVAVNVSARSLLDELLADRIARHLNHHDVPAGMLTVEITETSVMADVGRALVTLERLDELGVQISVDDYGTGYSSLTYLRKLPVRELKIDRGFIANVLTDEHDEVIVRSTIELGRRLGLRVVAEGIENTAIAARLRHLGCAFGQGIGFAPPMSLPELDRWLAGGPYRIPGRDRGDGGLATA